MMTYNSFRRKRFSRHITFCVNLASTTSPCVSGRFFPCLHSFGSYDTFANVFRGYMYFPIRKLWLSITIWRLFYESFIFHFFPSFRFVWIKLSRLDQLISFITSCRVTNTIIPINNTKPTAFTAAWLAIVKTQKHCCTPSDISSPAINFYRKHLQPSGRSLPPKGNPRWTQIPDLHKNCWLLQRV